MQAKFYLSNLEATIKFGHHLGQILQPKTLIALCGEMGSGKTTLVQAIAKGLQVEELVVSPTFVMINEYYTGRLPLYHLDLYRFIDQPGPDFSLIARQLEEITGEKGIVIIEWAEILFNCFGNDLEDFCAGGYLKLDIATEKNNDRSRLLTATTVCRKNDQSLSNLFADLCELSKFFRN